jgi:hypothetical protein
MAAGEALPMPQLVEIMTTVPQRYTTGGYPLTWGGFTWQAVGLAIEPIEDEAGNGDPSQITLALPAVTSKQLALALVEPIDGVRVRIYDALVDPDTMVVEHAELVWSGTANTPGIDDGDVATMTILCEHRAAIAFRPKASRYTNDEQQRLYPGDTAFDYDPGLDRGSVVWPAASFFRQ